MASRSDPTKRLITACYGLIWLLLLGAVAYLLARRESVQSPPLMISLGLFIVFSFLAVGTATRLFACLALTTLFVPFYLFEAYLWLTTAPDLSSSKLIYLAKLRQQGLAAYPSVSPRGFLDLWQKGDDGNLSPIVIDGREILPLAGIPDVLTVYCQAKDLTMVAYRSDAFGFRNPTMAGRRAAPEFVLLGDSFVQGNCISDHFTYAEQLSVLGPIASYGMDGNSALTQLAIFREYVKSLRAHHVIWFFYEGNDIGDYLLERTWPLLSAYLQHGYLQGLIRLNGPISLAMKRLIDQRLGSVDLAALEYAEKSGNLKPAVDFLLLRRAREAFRLVRIPKLPDLAATEWREITDIWREVIETQRGHGGQITFVYIPSHVRFLAHDPTPFQALERTVVTLRSSLSVDYVSLTASIEAAENPLAYYDGHFNEKGYRLTAEAIVEHLRRSANE